MVTDILRIPVGREVHERARWLVRQRWFALLFGLVVVLVSAAWLGEALPVVPLLLTLGLVALGNLGMHIVTARPPSTPDVRRAQLLMHAQTVADLVGLTAVLHFSGGLENPFSIYYVLIVGMASILMSRRDAYAYAAAAAALWIGLLLAEATGLLPHHNLAGFRLPVRYREPVHLVAESVVLITGTVGVAYIGANIIDRLREGELKLYEANQACQYRARELADLNTRLEELDRTRSLFIRLVTHELRAPVAAIKSYLRLILDGYVPEERLHEIVARAEQRAGHQLDLIQDLLDLAHVQQPTEERREAVDVRAVLDDVMDLMEARIADQGLEVIIQEPVCEARVVAQPEHINQLWVNLISNAIKYTPRGGHITISVRCAAGRVRGSVSDTGIGMTPEEVAHVFEPFYRTEAAKAMAHHGTGLGLSIVQGVVGHYGGTMSVDSEPGQGSTFTFDLPVATPEQLEELQPAPASTARP